MEKLEQLIAETVAASMDDFAKTAIVEATLSTIKDTGYITLEEATIIENFVMHVVTEAAEDFVPSEEEIQAMIDKLKELGYEVESPEEEAKEEAGGEEEGGEGAGEEEGSESVQESTSLADAIAKKLQIL